jgi:lipoate-protein ligase A
MESGSTGYLAGPILRSVLRSVAEGKALNTIILAKPNKHTIGYGHHADPDCYVDYNYCKSRDDVDVVRMVFGCGALSWDMGCYLTLIIAKKEAFKSKGFGDELYREMLTLIAEAEEKAYGVPVRHRPLNDTEIKGKKVGGWGGFSAGDALTFYGFEQVKEPDYETAERALRTPPEKIADKGIAAVAERIAYLEGEAGREIPFDEHCKVLQKAFEEHFDMTLVPGELTDEEKARADAEWAKLSSDEWNLVNTDERKLGPLLPEVRRGEYVTKIPGGPALRVVTYTKEHKIQNISITGSIHCDPPETPFWIEDALRGVAVDENIIRAKIEEVFTRGKVAMGTPDDFVRAVMGALGG